MTSVPDAERRYSDFAIMGRLLHQAKPYWRHLVALFLFSLLATPLALVGPLPVKIAVDSVIGSHPLPGILGTVLPDHVEQSPMAVLAVAAVLVVAITVLTQFQVYGSWFFGTYTGQKLILEFRARIFRHAQRLSLTYHDAKGSADSIYRIIWDAPAVQDMAVFGLIPFVSAMVTVITMMYVMLRLDWQLAAVGLAIVPVLATISHVYHERLRDQSRQVSRLESSVQSVLQEVLGSLRVVKAFGQEDREEKRFVERSMAGDRARLRLVYDESGLCFLAQAVTAVGTAIVLFIGVRHVRAGDLTLGELLLIIGYLAQLYRPIEALGQKAAALQRHFTSAERVFALLDESRDVTEQLHARPVSRASGALSFQNVSFAYPRDSIVLRDLAFEISPGSRVGIVGATGAGKTTLVNLLMRFYDPVGGAILLDGVDLREYRIADLRNQFSIVLQEPVLFSASIAENIAYARPGASHDEIVEAAKAAGADEFITRLPSGYATVVGERGMRLSGGERQRIALARAFLKDAPVVILDEPTSSVDPKTEAGIIESMEHLMRGRTSFTIAHRPETLRFCDTVLTIENGSLTRVTSSRTARPAEAAVLYGTPAGTQAAV